MRRSKKRRTFFFTAASKMPASFANTPVRATASAPARPSGHAQTPPITYAQFCGQAPTRLAGTPCFEQAVDARQAVLRGEMRVHELSNGLILYTASGEDLIEGRSGNALEPGIKATFVLSGATELGYGDKHFQLDARRGGARSAVLLAVSEAERFSRVWQRGRQERKVVLTLTAEWIEAVCQGDSGCGRSLARFSGRHLHELPWSPSARVRAQAARLFEAPAADGLLARLQRESIALDIASDVAHAVSGVGDCEVRLPPRAQARLAKLQDLLDSGEADSLSLREIACHVGSNTVDLQNHFRLLHGTTIFAYLRERRLGQAHERLLRQSISVEEAARHSGYRSLSAFSTAFKKRYGVSPSRLGRPA